LVPATDEKGGDEGAMVREAPSEGGVHVNCVWHDDGSVVEDVINTVDGTVTLVVRGFPRRAKSVVWRLQGGAQYPVGNRGEGALWVGLGPGRIEVASDDCAGVLSAMVSQEALVKEVLHVFMRAEGKVVPGPCSCGNLGVKGPGRAGVGDGKIGADDEKVRGSNV
jgi:hypothetical protein